MMERANMEAYRQAADKHFKAKISGDAESTDIALKLMAAILDSEIARREIFVKYGIQDLENAPVMEGPTEEPSRGQILKASRKKLHLTQEQTAARVGLSRQWYGAVEKDRIMNPGPDNLQKLLDALEINPESEEAKSITKLVE